MAFGPILTRWDGEVFWPAKRHMPTLDKELVVDDVYTIAEVEGRDERRHKAFFARINDRFKSLPESWGDFFKSPDDLRMWALIHTGFCHQDTFTLQDAEEAQRFALYIKKADKNFRIVDVRGNVVTVYVPESQRVLRNGIGMDNERFLHSIRKVDQYLEMMIG